MRLKFWPLLVTFHTVLHQIYSELHNDDLSITLKGQKHERVSDLEWVWFKIEIQVEKSPPRLWRNMKAKKLLRKLVGLNIQIPQFDTFLSFPILAFFVFAFPPPFCWNGYFDYLHLRKFAPITYKTCQFRLIFAKYCC